MKFGYSILLGIGLGLGSFVSAGSVSGTNIVAGTGDTLITSSLSSPLSGGIATIGYFATSFDVNAAVASQDYASLFANFTSLASASLGDVDLILGEDVAGYYNIGDTSYGAPGALTGIVLYTFFGSGATLEGSSEIGLVRSNQTIDAETFPPDSNFLDPTEGTILIGTQGTTNANLGPLSDGAVVSVNTLRLVQVIPEPSTALLGAVGALGLLRRRRN